MKSEDLLDAFTDYCRDNPNESFWRALRNWSGQAAIFASKSGKENSVDTYYWEARNGLKRSVDSVSNY